MAEDGVLATEEERTAQKLVDQARTILSGLRGDIPDGFVAQMFARVSAEDLVGYDARTIASLAEEAWSFLQVRPAGAPRLRIEAAAAAPEAGVAPVVSVIEIANDNMPFLLDSVMGALTEHGLEPRLVVHPIFTIERDAHGTLIGFRGDQPATGNAVRESFIHIHVDRIDDETQRTALARELEEVLAEVRLCVGDWRAMLARVGEAIAELNDAPPPLPEAEVRETAQFLEWLVGNNFTFLGLREYAYAGGATGIAAQPDTGLGILRDRGVQELSRDGGAMALTPEIRAFLQQPRALIITKADLRARVHRRVPMDYVGVKRFDAAGNPVGELRILGLFTSTAYTRSARSIPYLRRKVDAVLRKSRLDPESHSGKALINVLENYPRDELFQIDTETLSQFAGMIAQLEERPRVRVLARRDQFDRSVSVLVYLPRDRYDTNVRIAIGNHLAQAFAGRVVAFFPSFQEGTLVRVLFIIARTGGQPTYPDRRVLEEAIGALVRSWSDGLAEALLLVHPAPKGRALHARYRDAFSAAYREATPPSLAVADIRMLETLTEQRTKGVDFYRRADMAPERIGLKVWSRGTPIPLSERVPVLEHMGFKVVDERTYRIEPEGAEIGVYLHDMLLEAADGRAIDSEALDQRLEACFIAVMRQQAEDDGYNALVLAAGLPWRDIALVRALSRFLRQARIAYSQDYMWATLQKHAPIAAMIVELFHVRFDPRRELDLAQRAERERAVATEIEAALQEVASLDEDRILRRFVNAVRAAIRTNFYQVGDDGQPRPAIAIKFDSRKLDDLPLPRPLYEIFCYAPRVEGVHLRFGKVARGGLRWSDRPQDFRTEVLGLVKAQQVKNAVIVPVGAKGGFVPKWLPSGPRDAIQAEGTAAYQMFVSSLLDITDNLDAETVAPPPATVRHDSDDPYLVVAADKGTATFSDTANALSLQRGFWLGDAFASGGSAGYDHKKMGITARGAFEAVKRHFRELDLDITTAPFTVAGVGDMSGDVFGNGMLLAKTARLVAAFDHRDIFIDPTPDPASSWAERKRLFDLPRSSWQDYDKTLISAGGGVFPRSAKEIVLSPQAQKLLGLAAARATPQQVISAILRLDVDLLWFGGIGTYVRASNESDEQVGDKVNDPIRVSADTLRCRVIGEGANLGMTQRGRIEAASRGIRLNTDAIDNSAGVNTSDLEVNIKIALGPAVRDGRLPIAERNALLASMTDEVSALVLRNNYQQTLALSLAERRGIEDLGFQQRLMQVLEAEGELDRAVEFLPDDKEIAERRKRGLALTRPELAVLLAYAKLALHGALLDSTVPDDPYLARELVRYFPRPLSERFPDGLENHRLRREIIATQLSNSMINRGGPGFVVRMQDQTGAAIGAIAAAFAAVRDSFGMTALNGAIDKLDGKVPGRVQLDLYGAVQDLLLEQMVWFLRNVDLNQGLAQTVSHYREGIGAVAAAGEDALSPDLKAQQSARTTALVEAGVPEPLARAIATLPSLAAAPDVILVADRSGRPVAEVAATHFAAGAHFRLDRILGAVRALAVSDYFDRLALDRAVDAITDAERQIVAAMVRDGASGFPAVEAWVTPRTEQVTRIQTAIDEIVSSGLTVSKVSVAASLIGDLART